MFLIVYFFIPFFPTSNFLIYFIFCIHISPYLCFNLPIFSLILYYLLLRISYFPIFPTYSFAFTRIFSFFVYFKIFLYLILLSYFPPFCFLSFIQLQFFSLRCPFLIFFPILLSFLYPFSFSPFRFLPFIHLHFLFLRCPSLIWISFAALPSLQKRKGSSQSAETPYFWQLQRISHTQTCEFPPMGNSELFWSDDVVSIYNEPPVYSETHVGTPGPSICTRARHMCTDPRHGDVLIYLDGICLSNCIFAYTCGRSLTPGHLECLRTLVDVLEHLYILLGF